MFSWEFARFSDWQLACEQALHLGDILKRRRARASRGFTARSRVLAGLASLAEIREFVCRLTHRLFFVLYAISTLNFTRNGFNKESCATSVGYTIFWFTILRFFATPRQISSNFTILRLRKFVLKTIISFTIFSIPLFYNCSLLLSDFTRIAFR